MNSYKVLKELSDCPDCGAEPKNYCVIEIVRRREAFEKNHATVKCINCGYTASVTTSKNPIIIRNIWNVRNV